MKYDSRVTTNLTKQISIEETWKMYLDKIQPADRTAMELAKKRWNSVAKPIGSLGILEEDIIKIAGIRGNTAELHWIGPPWQSCAPTMVSLRKVFPRRVRM